MAPQLLMRKLMLHHRLTGSGHTAFVQLRTWGRGAMWAATARHLSWQIRRPALIEVSSPGRWKGNLPGAHDAVRQRTGPRSQHKHACRCEQGAERGAVTRGRAASTEMATQRGVNAGKRSTWRSIQQRDCMGGPGFELRCHLPPDSSA